MTGDTSSFTLLGISVGLQTIEELTDSCLDAAKGRRAQVTLACANPHSLVVAQSDPDFHDALRDATFVVADGVGVTLVSRLVSGIRAPRVTGYDLFTHTMAAFDACGGGRVYFLGSTETTLAAIRRRCAADFPNVWIAGMRSPPFGAFTREMDDALVAEINQSRADMLWVGMTAPKQEKWVAANQARIDVPIIGSIGAVFDYYAGNVRRAPEWLCSSGFEWLYRLVGEPRRLWRRTMVSGPKFVRLVLQERLSGA